MIRLQHQSGNRRDNLRLLDFQFNRVEHTHTPETNNSTANGTNCPASSSVLPDFYLEIVLVVVRAFREHQGLSSLKETSLKERKRLVIVVKSHLVHAGGAWRQIAVSTNFERSHSALKTGLIVLAHLMKLGVSRAALTSIRKSLIDQRPRGGDDSRQYRQAPT